MLRPVLAALVIAPILLALPPAGALTDAAGHGYAYQTWAPVEPGGWTAALVTMWNNGTTSDTVTGGDSTSGHYRVHWQGQFPLAPGQSATTSVQVFADDTAPVGASTVPIPVDWASGARQRFDFPLHVVPPQYGLTIRSDAARYTFDPRGSSFNATMMISNAGGDDVHANLTYRIMDPPAGSTGPSNSTTAFIVPAHSNANYWFPVDWGHDGWWPPPSGTFTVNVTIDNYDYAIKTRLPSTTFLLDVNDSSEGATIAVTPPNATGEPGRVFPYHAVFEETSGHATRYHFDVNTTDASPNAPQLGGANMVVILQPHERREVDFWMSTTNATPERQYRIVATLTSEITNVLRAETFVLLNVARAENIVMYVNPTSAEVDAGGNATYYATLSEQAGHDTITRMSVALVSGHASDLYVDFDGANATLTANGTRATSVYVRAAPNATPGERILRIQTISAATGITLAQREVSFVVRPPVVAEASARIDVTPEHAEVMVDAKVAFRATITELSGRDTRVRVTITPPGPRLGVPTDLQMGGEVNVTYDDSPILLSANSQVTVDFAAYPVNETRLGDHAIRVDLADADTGRSLGSANATLTVRPSHALTDARYHIEASLENDSVVAGSKGTAGLRVHVWQNGTATAHVRASVNASPDLLVASPQAASADVAPHDTTTLAFTLTPGPSAGLAGPHPILVYVYADNDTTSAWTVLRANVTFDPSGALLVSTEPTTAARGERANFTIHVTNSGARALRVSLAPHGTMNASATHLDMAAGSSADVQAWFTIPDDAEIGSSVARVLAFEYESTETNVTLDATVSPIAIPPTSLQPDVAPQADLSSPLKTAASVIVEHPGAAISLGVAASAVVALPLTRREPWKYVAMAAALPLYTRLAKPELLSDTRRGEIHAIVAAKPGISLTELVRATKLSTGALVHHLRMLERHGFLTSRKDGKLRRFFVVGNVPSALVASPTAMQEQILGLLAARAMTRPEIGAALGLTQQGVSYHVKNLERAGRVVVRRDGSEARVHRVYDVVVVSPRVEP